MRKKRSFGSHLGGHSEVISGSVWDHFLDLVARLGKRSFFSKNESKHVCFLDQSKKSDQKPCVFEGRDPL